MRRGFHEKRVQRVSGGVSHRAGVALILTAALCASPAEAGKPYRFDDSGYLGEAALMPEWSATMDRELSQAPILDACLADETRCPSYYLGLRRLLLNAETLDPRRRISLINHYVNRKRYHTDRAERIETPLADEPLKYRSRWATVEEFVRQGGDCEDYATTKYYLLRRLGFTTDDLRVVVTWDGESRGYHAVLAVRFEGKVLLLESDNTIRRGSAHRYRFIYSINEDAIWDHAGSPDQPTEEETSA